MTNAWAFCVGLTTPTPCQKLNDGAVQRFPLQIPLSVTKSASGPWHRAPRGGGWKPLPVSYCSLGSWPCYIQAYPGYQVCIPRTKYHEMNSVEVKTHPFPLKSISGSPGDRRNLNLSRPTSTSVIHLPSLYGLHISNPNHTILSVPNWKPSP